MKKGFTPILIVILVLGFITIAGGGFYFVQKYSVENQDWTDDIVPVESSSPTSNPCMIPEGCPPQESGTGNWKTFTSKDGEHKISYPPDWTLTDKSEPSNVSPGSILTNIQITKNGHKLISYELDAWHGSICLYDEKKQPDDPYAIEMGNYVEISAQQGKFRRSAEPDNESTYLSWSVCSNIQPGGFSIVSAIGLTNYETPIKYEQKLIDTMDKILSTYTYSE